MPRTSKRAAARRRKTVPVPVTAPTTRQLDAPAFAQPEPTADPTTFVVNHPSDGPAYKVIDQLNKEHKIFPLPFPNPRGFPQLPEPQLTLADVFGPNSAATNTIKASGQIVFHSVGDCGSTTGPGNQNKVSDKMVADFSEADAKDVPQFNFLLGDIVYSFGESQYYLDQFYEPYRNYPAPILAAAGNHDGMVSPVAHAASLDAFLRNFCSTTFVVTKDAGALSRTAQIQPGVFFTFDAIFVRIVALYSNTLEDPGWIADPPGQNRIGSAQIAYLKAALTRVKTEGYKGALIIAHHHPPYTAGSSRHGWSVQMLADIDKACKQVGVWPHAVLSGHAHNYQRFTRTRSDGSQVPYVVCGNGGHNVQRLTKSGTPLRTPQIVQAADSAKNVDQVVFENYDDGGYGYLRVIADPAQLRIEYHPAGDGTQAKTPDAFVTVDLATRKLVHFVAPNLGLPRQAQAIQRRRLQTRGRPVGTRKR